jgi:hypothetical protein
LQSITSGRTRAWGRIEPSSMLFSRVLLIFPPLLNYILLTLVMKEIMLSCAYAKFIPPEHFCSCCSFYLENLHFHSFYSLFFLLLWLVLGFDCQASCLLGKCSTLPLEPFHRPILCWVCFFFLFLNSFIHMCMHRLGHFSPLSPAPSLFPTSRQNLFCPFL